MDWLPAGDWHCAANLRPSPPRCAHPSCNKLLANQVFILEQSPRSDESVTTVNFPSPVTQKLVQPGPQNISHRSCPISTCPEGRSIYQILRCSKLKYFAVVFTSFHALKQHLIAIHEIRADVLEEGDEMWGGGHLRNKVAGAARTILTRRSAEDFIKIEGERGKAIFECQYGDCSATRSTQNGIRKHILEMHR